MKKFFAVIMVAFVALGAAFSEGNDTLETLRRLRSRAAATEESGGGDGLSKGGVSTSALKALLSDKFPDAKIDEDGDLLIKRNGINTYVFVEDKKVLLKFFTRWSASDSVSASRALKIVNKWNCDKVFTVASYDDKKFILRYYLSYEGGVNATNFNDSLEWFFSLSSAFGNMLSDEDAI